MRITIIAHGRIKIGPEYDLINKYKTRFNRRFKNNSLSSLKIIESNEDERVFNDKLSANMELIRRSIVLDRSGALLSSDVFTEYLAGGFNASLDETIFIIGGASGLPKIIVDQAKWVVSISKMIFPHKIARLILVEQLYRAKCIINSHPYHKN